MVRLVVFCLMLDNLKVQFLYLKEKALYLLTYSRPSVGETMKWSEADLQRCTNAASFDSDQRVPVKEWFVYVHTCGPFDH